VSGGQAEEGAARSTVRTVLGILGRNRELQRVELAFATFNATEWGTWLAMLVYGYSRGGVTETGILATVMLVPAAVFAPLIAAAGERYAPGRALLAGYVCEAVSCAAVGLAMLVHASTLLVYPLLALPSVAFTMTRPTQSAFVPGVARRPEDLAAANVISGWIEAASTLLGPLLVGVILTVGSPGVVFAAAAAVCAVGAALVWPLRDAVPAATRGEEAGEERGGSIAFLRTDPNARTLLLLLGGQFVAIGALDVLYVELARGVLHRGGSWAGYLEAAFGAGAVLAFVVTARLVGLRHLARPLVFSLAAWTIALAGLAATPGAVTALVLFAFAGGARSTFDVTGRTLLQRVARPDLLARVFGLLEGLEMAALGLGSLLAPALVWLGGPAAAFGAVAALLPLIAVSTGRRLLDIDRHATVPVVEIALLRSVPWLGLMPGPTLESVARSLVPSVSPAGTDVITQGDEGDLFYVIADGEVDVIHDGTFVTTLGRGSWFGEIALMYDVPRTATVRARSEARLYSLDRDTFLGALVPNGSSLTAARAIADERLDELQALGRTA
jgi:hypothetical protein